MKQLKERICFSFELEIAILLTGMVLINVLQVITRYFVAVTIIWVEDASVYALHWIIAGAMPMLWLSRSHMIMDVADTWFSAKILKMLDFLTQLSGLLFGLIFAWKSYCAVVVNRGYILSVLGYDEMWKYVPYVVAGCLLSCAAAINIAEVFMDKKAERREKDE